MKKTLHIDEQLLLAAKSAVGSKTDTETVRLGLEALVRHAAYERLRALRGSGDVGGRKKLLADYSAMHQAPTVPHSDVVRFVRDRGLHGRGIGWIDAHLLASSLVGRLKLWTADPRLKIAAAELGGSYTGE